MSRLQVRIKPAVSNRENDRVKLAEEKSTVEAVIAERRRVFHDLGNKHNSQVSMSRLQGRMKPAVSNRENDRVKLVTEKPTVEAVIAERRRAFHDLSNKHNSQAAGVVKLRQPTAEVKPLVFKMPAPLVVNKRKPNAVNSNKSELEKSDTFNLTNTSNSSKLLQCFEKVDLSSDPQLVSEYVNDIYAYLRELEEKYTIKRDFLAGHRSTPRVRQILVDWLVDAHQSFKMCLETLHVTIAILDRFLEVHKDVGKESLQLVGATALFVAAKYEEIYSPELSDIEYICDHAFTKKQILSMEQKILHTLNHELGRPLSINFLRRLNRSCQATQEHHSLGKYLLELCLLNYELCHVPPSLQAAAACCLANGILGDITSPSNGWSEALIHFSQYRYQDLKGVLTKMACLLGSVEVSKQQVIREKYSKSKYDKISLHSKLRGSLVRKLAAQSTTLHTNETKRMK